MMTQPSETFRGIPRAAALTVTVVIVACSVYANLSFVVDDQRIFPPFTGTNRNHNRGLGAENFNIARSMVAGQGFANPFDDPTGPTAWMPPVLPTLLAGMWWISGEDHAIITAIVVVLQVFTLVLTGLLILALTRPTLARLGAWSAAVVFLIVVLSNFYRCFQLTHDSWIILLVLDLLVAGLCWCRPLASKRSAAGWGLFGGFCALVNPIVGFTWGMLSLGLAAKQRAWSRFGVTILCAALALLPWSIRNYLVLGRLIPVKSNVAYELWQSQCLRYEDGLLSSRAFVVHPYSGAQRIEYETLGEMAFLDKKSEEFWAAVRADPMDFLDRACGRFLGATLWYVPLNRSQERQQSVVTWYSHLLHSLPFLGLLVLACSAFFVPLARAQWVVMGVYILYLLPYIAISYYERYGFPLLGIKALLIIWAADRLLLLRSPRRRGPGAGVREWGEPSPAHSPVPLDRE